MKFDVKSNTKRNIIIGIANKIILLVLPFIVRSYINNYLGSEYLGLNSLFSSILQVLMLSELGISSALIYHMYKPIAENDQKTINALLSLYKKAYLIIGIVIITLGLAIIPFFPLLIKGDSPSSVNIRVIYVIQLINTSISYFLFGYKQSLLVAYQREDINSLINLFSQSTLQLTQIILLLKTKNYYTFVVCMPVFTILNNLCIGFFTKRMFPCAKCEGTLDRSVLSDTKKLIAGTFIQKACTITRNSLGSICISAFIGLSLTGIYNNYYTILSGVTLMLGIVSTSLSGGIGNHVALKSKEENFYELSKLDFLYMNISSWCTACLLCIYQPFMKLWMGADMLLSPLIVILLSLYFYILKMGDMRSLYSSANGLWWEMRYRSIVETIVNVALNIILGMLYGICGIVLATIISIFVCNFLWSTSILFLKYFGRQKMKYYFGYHAKYFIFALVVCSISYYISGIIHFANQVVSIFARGAICSIVFLFCFILVYRKSKILIEALHMLKK